MQVNRTILSCTTRLSGRTNCRMKHAVHADLLTVTVRIGRLLLQLLSELCGCC